MTNIDRAQIPGATLAYLGDAVFEVLVRRHLLESGVTHPGRLNKMALDFVKAVNQSAGVSRLLPHLTKEEEAIYRRGRNANGIAAPKSASVGDYRRATGLEALFAYLYLGGEEERAWELFGIAFPLGAEQEMTPSEAQNAADSSAEREIEEEMQSLSPRSAGDIACS